MSVLLEVCVETLPFERVDTELAVAGFFLDERPLRGAAGRADWRLCGAVSDLIVLGRLRGKLGEALLVPSYGRLGAERVLLLGLGRRSSFKEARARAAGAAAVERALSLGARSLAFAPPESGTTVAPALVQGALAAARAAGSSAALQLIVDPDEERATSRALADALPGQVADEIRVVSSESRKLASRSPVGISVPGLTTR